MPQNNDLSDYVLKEYEHVSTAYFKSHENTATWVKYYLVIIAAPLSVIAFMYKEYPEKLNLWNLPSFMAELFVLVGVIGLFIASIVINYRLDSTLYARTVNGLRKYFVDMGITDKIGGMDENNIRKYFVLPVDTSYPLYFKFSSDLFFITLFMSILNSLYIAIGFHSFIGWNCVLILITFISLSLHFLYYILNGIKKNKSYGKHKNDREAGA